MERRDIEEAANEYIGYSPEVDEGICTFASRKAFRNGAEWAINSVWHKADDAPEIPRQVLVECEDGSVRISVLYTTRVNRKSWKRWAYIEDLLPIKS